MDIVSVGRDAVTLPVPGTPGVVAPVAAPDTKPVPGLQLGSDRSQVAPADPWPEVSPLDVANIDVPEANPARQTAAKAEGNDMASSQAKQDGWRTFRASSKQNQKGWQKFRAAQKQVDVRKRLTSLEQRIGKFNQRIGSFKAAAARARAAGDGQAAAFEALATGAQSEVSALGRVRDQFQGEMGQILGDERSSG